MKKNIEISIVIVTYNSEKHISDCIKSISENNINYEIIIVDNNSEDSTIKKNKKTGY